MSGNEGLHTVEIEKPEIEMNNSQEQPNGETEVFIRKKLTDGEDEDTLENKLERKKPLRSKLLAVAFYWFVSISLTFLNKTVMTGAYLKLDAPLFMSWTQFVMTVLCCAIMSEVGKRVQLFSFFPPLEFDIKKARKILPLTVVFLGMIVFNNLCIKYVEVSFYYIARSLTIIFNILFTYYLLSKTTSKKSIACCLTIIGGYALGVQSEVHFSQSGVLFGVLASVFVALNSIYAKKMLVSVTNESSELLMLYNNINSIFILPFIALLTTDERSVLMQPESLEVMTTPDFWIMILFTGVFGFLIGYASYLQVLYTSPLTHNVSGTAKAAFQTMLALWVYANPTNPQNLISVAVVLLASFAYGIVK